MDISYTKLGDKRKELIIIAGMAGADVFVGVSVGNIVTEEMIKGMNSAPFIFAMANPEPEILPDLAYKAGASIVGTGRSDLFNQVNNALVFPGLFKGLFAAGVRSPSQKDSSDILSPSRHPRLVFLCPSGSMELFNHTALYGCNR